MSINDHTGVPIYANAADAKESFRQELKKNVSVASSRSCQSGVNAMQLLICLAITLKQKQQRQQLGRKSPHFEQSRTRSRRRFFR